MKMADGVSEGDQELVATSEEVLSALDSNLGYIARDLVSAKAWLSGGRKSPSQALGTVFGSARTDRSADTYSLARELGRLLALHGWTVLTGGGPGIMQAIRDGAGHECSQAVRIEIAGEEPETALDSTRSITVESFALRKLLLVWGVQALWVFPGGVGTMDELFEVLVLQDTARLNRFPVVLVEPQSSTYWSTWLNFVEVELISRGLASRTVLNTVKRVTSAQQALDEALESS